ncbi:hypothetical protein [Parasphingorhabdus sp.]|uniref:hypothetical protein n=1 Tax=Parasphingorhabdus sp. TaxID=2709688 RepID=UPI003A8FC3AF
MLIAGRDLDSACKTRFPYLAFKAKYFIPGDETRKKPLFSLPEKMIPKAILHSSKMVARRRASVSGIAGFRAIKRTIS